MGLRLRFYCISFFVLLGASPVLAAELKVAVASNFAATAEVLVDEFTQQSGHEVTLLIGSSGKHTAQIQYGLSADVFMAADAKRPKLLEQKGFALTGSSQTYAQGRLVVWSADNDFFETGLSPTITSTHTSTVASAHTSAQPLLKEPTEVSVNALNAILSSSEQHIVSIANPKIAPYGLAAKQVLDGLGLKPRLVYGESVAQAFQFVNSGGAQLGLIALAQVTKLGFGSYLIIPEALHAPIVQQLVIINDSEAARQWRDFVLGEAAQSIIQSSGYRRARYRYLRSEAG